METSTTLFDIIGLISDTINQLIPIIVTLALVAFLWGLLRFMVAAGDEKAIEVGKKLMVWGVIILFIMVTVWGLVKLLNTIFGIGQGGEAEVPRLNTELDDEEGGG